MQPARFIRLWGFLLGLGLVGFLLGCSGERTAAPLEPGAGKQIGAEIKADRKTGAMERAAAKKEMLQERKRGRGRGE
jgi:hypothetical protein